MNYLRAQVNFRQLRAETAGNRYMRRFLPASAGIFTCGSVYLRPLQVILHAPVLQCSQKFVRIIVNQGSLGWNKFNGNWITGRWNTKVHQRHFKNKHTSRVKHPNVDRFCEIAENCQRNEIWLPNRRFASKVFFF